MNKPLWLTLVSIKTESLGFMAEKKSQVYNDLSHVQQLVSVQFTFKDTHTHSEMGWGRRAAEVGAVLGKLQIP
jgi:hypothetical protein